MQAPNKTPSPGRATASNDEPPTPVSIAQVGENANEEIPGGGSINWCRIYNDLVDVYSPVVGDTGIAIYVVLSRHAHNERRTCFPSYTTIGKKAGCSRSAAIKAIDILCQCRMITKTPRTLPETGKPTSNLYRLCYRREWLPISELQHLIPKSKKKRKKRKAKGVK